MDGNTHQGHWPARGFLSKNGWIWNGEGWVPNEGSSLISADVLADVVAEAEARPEKQRKKHASELEAPTQASDFARRMNELRPPRRKPGGVAK